MPASLNKNNSGRFHVMHSDTCRISTYYAHQAVKRIMQEAKELANDPSTDYSAAPLEVRDILHCSMPEINVCWIM